MTIIVNEGNPGCHNTSTMTSGGVVYTAYKKMVVLGMIDCWGYHIDLVQSDGNT